MARGDQLGRQWKIIQHLLAARNGKTASELAAQLDCHRRTVYRDLEALQIAGFPLYAETVDGRSRWAILETMRQQIPLPLNLTELMALYFSRDMVKVLRDTPFFDSLESLFEKIKATLPPEYLTYLAHLEQTLQVGERPYKPYGELADRIDTLNAAIIDRICVALTYRSVRRGKTSRRTVAPYRIWFFDGTFYLIGYCHRRRDVRLFAVDRMVTLAALDEPFEMPADFDAEEYMRASFGVFRGDPVTVRVRFSSRVAEYIRERVWHASQRLTGQDDGSLLFEVEVAGTEEIKYWLLRWGAEAEVLAPARLRDEMRRETQRMAARYVANTKAAKR